jgi:sialic acid synthase SpsE
MGIRNEVRAVDHSSIANTIWEQMRIGPIEFGGKTLIVAEIGNNHNGDFELAKQLVRCAAEAGADAVKFQTYHGEQLVLEGVTTFGHVAGQHRTQLERFKSLEFTPTQWETLAGIAAEHRVIFLSSVFDEEAVDLFDHVVPAYKIASGDVTNSPLLRYVARMGKPVILSTGMATSDEIARALEDLRGCPVILLHCVSRYPTPFEAANLLSIPFLRNRFRIPVGYSDHTLGNLACLAAVVLGAVVIEKHFTLDKTIPVGDHLLSVTPDEFRELVQQVRQIESALGVCDKLPGAGELAMRSKLRRSLYARHEIPAGHIVTLGDFIALRPGVGLAPSVAEQLVGRKSLRTLAAKSLITEEDFADQ